ncbi:MiaB/RimO family radical SAM methylthiotransferase [Atopobiaceae bacterium 24-176]
MGADRMPRVALVNLGCRVNRVELDAMASKLEAMGCELAAQEDADVVVVNTCAVTGEAEAKARKAVRHAAALPGVASVVATGCVASLFADELDALGGNVRVEVLKDQVPAAVVDALAEAGLAPDPAAERPDGAGSVTPTGRMRPGIKVQDGCDNRCTYCIVWKARGPARSLPLAKAVEDVRRAVEAGAGEVVLTGINLGRYDGCAGGLTGLLSALLEQTDVGRVRLSSVEPGEVTEELLDLMAASSGRVAPFLHLPLQSGCDATLARMGRLYTVDEYRAVAQLAKERVPGVALATDLIVGFPGETDEEFAESLAFCRSVGYANMHVFRYSKRPGTWAAGAPGQVPPHLSAERSRTMRSMAAESRRAFAAGLVGEPLLAFVERPGRAVSGQLVEVLVDPDLPMGAFATVRPHGVLSDGRLDARASLRTETPSA